MYSGIKCIAFAYSAKTLQGALMGVAVVWINLEMLVRGPPSRVSPSAPVRRISQVLSRLVEKYTEPFGVLIKYAARRC